MRTHSTSQLVNGIRRQVWAFSCIPHHIYGKRFLNPRARQRFIMDHQLQSH